MGLVKFGHATTITQEDLKDSEAIFSNPEIQLRFEKVASTLKTLAPKAKDFLYFSAIMMHSAEASLLDADGNIKKDASGNEVESRWEKKGESWRWVCSDSTIKPYKNSNCLVPGTKILMSDGSIKNIEDVKIGDQVITHKNRTRKVTTVFSRQYDGKVYELQTSNLTKIVCTPEHPFYLLNQLDSDSAGKRFIKNKKFDYKFITAEDLSLKNILLAPKLKNTVASDLTTDSARMLGLFAAEGSYTHKHSGVVFSFSSKEYNNLATETCDLAQSVFPDAEVNLVAPTPSQKNKCSLYVSGTNVAQYFKKYVGEYSLQKTLSPELVFGSDEIKLAFIQGWLEGDGHVDKKSGKVIGTTVSKNLAYQTKLILDSLQINNSLYHEIRKASKLKGREVKAGFQFRVKIPYNQAKVLIEKSRKLNFALNVQDRSPISYVDDYRLHDLIGKNELHYSGLVHNFEVEEDHSYVANGIITHNCDIFPEEELLKAYKKWIGKPLCLDHKSSSVDMIRGLILDTYYDKPNKRVVALCALDKKNYPDLARKVETGYAASVSMGTAVGKAICSDCGTVARVESEFCNCMRNRQCYGEINVDLNPIELSIVVNGADPKAKIRHIVAAANNLAKYVDMKEQEFSSSSFQHEMEAGLDQAIKKLESLKQEVKDLGEQNKIAPSNIKTASEGGADILEDIYQKLEDITEKVNKLSMKSSEEQHMTKKEAYFQGGGGINEPTPGKPKYEKEDEDSIRDKEDKQMLGQMDTGPVDGMHPGYDSFGESEEARKKRLQRLASEQEARQLRRQAALEKAKETIAVRKEGYFQGGGGINEPTPGKPKYEKEDEDSIRDKEDKQMTGQSPFPGVGAIDGLHPSPASADVKDELKRKQMLARAKLTAKFLEAAGSDGSVDKAESRWQVYADKKLILTATVKDISGGKVEALYDTINSHDFGTKLLTKIRVDGFDKVKNGLLKSAQAPTAAAPSAPAVAPPPGPAPDMGGDLASHSGGEPTDAGGTGDPKDQLPELLDKLEGTVADVRQGVEALTNDSGNELNDFQGLGGDAQMAPATASLVGMQKKLSRALLIGMKQATKELNKHISEIKMAQHISDNRQKIKKNDRAYVNSLITDACDDAKTTVADCYKLMEAFVKYAHGTDVLVKHASKRMNLHKTSQQHLAGDPLDPFLGGTSAPAKKPTSPSMKPLPRPAAPKPKPLDPKIDPKSNVMPDAYPGHERVESWLLNNTRDNVAHTPTAPPPSGQNERPVAPDSHKADDTCDEDDNCAIELKEDGTMTTDSPEEAGKAMKAMKSASFDLTTKEGRAMYRTKLAEKGLTFSDMLDKAHDKSGVTTQLDVKPTGDLAKVETLEETHKAMMDVANAPPRVRKMAEDIQKMVLAGRIDPTKDFPGLISQGLDKDAVSYWKSFWNDAGKEGSQFASELIKEHAAKKAAEDREVYQVKLARAYEVAYDMVRRGMIGDDRHALNQQVNELMKFNDDGFDSMKHWVERQPMAKTASIPQVGLIGSGEITFPAPEAATSDLVSSLISAFANRKY